MTKKELVDLGFKRMDVPNSESNNSYDYYYYYITIAEGLSLISNGNDQILNNNDWHVINFDWPDVKITEANNINKLKELIACSQQN